VPFQDVPDLVAMRRVLQRFQVLSTPTSEIHRPSFWLQVPFQDVPHLVSMCRTRLVTCSTYSNSKYHSVPDIAGLARPQVASQDVLDLVAMRKVVCSRSQSNNTLEQHFRESQKSFWLQVPFQDVPDLVAMRKVLLVRGQAYVQQDQVRCFLHFARGTRPKGHDAASGPRRCRHDMRLAVLGKLASSAGCLLKLLIQKVHLPVAFPCSSPGTRQAVAGPLPILLWIIAEPHIAAPGSPWVHQ